MQRQATVRLTWQATPRNKFNIHWAEQYNDSNYAKGGGTATTTPEATVRGLYIRPASPRLLVVAGVEPAPAGGRLGHVPGAVPLGPAHRRHA